MTSGTSGNTSGGNTSGGKHEATDGVLTPDQQRRGSREPAIEIAPGGPAAATSACAGWEQRGHLKDRGRDRSATTLRGEGEPQP